MSSTRTLTCSMPRSAWTDAFTMRLGELAQSMPPDEAARWAERTFDDAADLDPKEAAEIFATDTPPADEGAPGPAIGG